MFILLLVFSCTRSDDSYYPLGEGLQWRYVVNKTTMDGTRQQKYFFINLPVQKIKDQYASVKQSIDGTLYYYQDTKEGIIYLGKSLGPEIKFDEDKNYILFYPLEVGTQWEEITYSSLLVKTGPPQKTEFRIKARVPLVITIESVTDIVRVPAGTFTQCLRIVKKGSAYKDAGNYIGLTIVRIRETNWYAPGIGLVKSVREETTDRSALNRGELIIELESFRT